MRFDALGAYTHKDLILSNLFMRFGVANISKACEKNFPISL